MSLDVYLEGPAPATAPHEPVILLRENGQNREISLKEWNERFPGQQYVTVDVCAESLYTSNITHNLNKMAAAAGIYEHLWRPEEIGVSKASQLVAPLAAGLLLLKADPDRFKAYNPENGWGSYEGLVRFVEGYLAACREYPDAEVRASR